MAKLQRKSAKVFAEQAQANVGGIAQFGSLAAGNIQYSKDVDVIQGLEAYQQGWQAAVVGNKSPAMEDRNALDYLLSYQQAYIMQHGVPEWLSTETYYQNSYVVDGNGELRVSTIDDNTGHNPTEDNGGKYWGYAGARGSGKQVGEVYYSQSNLATDNKGALPLFTGELISNANNLYPQFYAWVLSHTELCKTQAQYDTAISTYGECPFYVINDTNKTIRLPKLTNYIKCAVTGYGIMQDKAGLPNITGTFSVVRRGGSEGPAPTGAFTQESNWDAKNGAGSGDSWGSTYSFSASQSNSTYGSSNTVTPAHTTLYPWVCAYQSAIPASTAQAAEFQQALSGKADVADLAEVQCVVETYHNGESWYRIWSDGWCEQGGYTGSVGYDTDITITLLKDFAINNYSVFLNYLNPSTSDDMILHTIGITTSNFTIHIRRSENSASGTRRINWTACGYLEGY